MMTTAHRRCTGLAGIPGLPGVQAGRPNPFQHGMLPTINGLGALGEMFAPGGQYIVAVLKKAYQEISGTPATTSGLSWWLQWLEGVRGTPEWKRLMEKHADFRMGWGTKPSVYYGIWKALAASVGAIRANALTGEDNTPANVMPYAVGDALDEDAWADLSIDFFAWICNAAGAGLINLNYLDVAIKCFAVDDLTQRKFPLFLAPPDARDDMVDSFAYYMKRIGYWDLMKRALRQTREGLAAQGEKLAATMKTLGVSESVLKFTSGMSVVESVQNLLSDYFRRREAYKASMSRFMTALANNVVSLTADEKARLNDLHAQLKALDQKIYAVTSQAGAWQGQSAPGQLGAFPVLTVGLALVVAGVVAVVLGMVVNLQGQVMSVQTDAYNRVQKTLDTQEAGIQKQYNIKLAVVKDSAAKGQITSAQLAEQALELERWKNSEMAKLLGQRKAVAESAPKTADLSLNVPGMGVGVGGTTLLVAAVGLVGLLMVARK